MEFLSDEEYMDMVRELQKMNGTLRLWTGNCGAFAVALRELFGVGRIMAIEGLGFVHVLLEYNGKYYDGETIYHSYDELINSKWGDYIERPSKFVDVEEKYEVHDFDDICSLMADKTCYYTGAEEFIPLIESNCRRAS